MHIIMAEAGSHLETSPAFKLSPNKLRSAKKKFHQKFQLTVIRAENEGHVQYPSILWLDHNRTVPIRKLCVTSYFSLIDTQYPLQRIKLFRIFKHPENLSKSELSTISLGN